MSESIFLAAAAWLAGFIDAIVGGGGLVLVPALFAAYPGTPPATLLGTNKGCAIWGTGWATLQYARRVQLNWAVLRPAAIAAVIGSFLGAWAVLHVPGTGMRRALPFLLAAVLIYTLMRKDLGREHRPRWGATGEWRAGVAIGAVIGFYDGFFGPGTGSFFVFLFVRLLGYDFLRASASAKLLNTATNGAALVVFGWQGHVLWKVAALMAVANVLGSLMGTRLALRHGAGFVRGVFIVVVLALIVKTGLDSWRL